MQPGSKWQHRLKHDTLIHQIWAKMYWQAVALTCFVLSHEHVGLIKQLLFWPRSAMTLLFTCWLIQTSDIVIEWSPLNGLNLYNTDRDREGRRGVKEVVEISSARQTQLLGSWRSKGELLRCNWCFDHSKLKWLTIFPQLRHKFVGGLMQKRGHVVIEGVHVLH